MADFLSTSTSIDPRRQELLLARMTGGSTSTSAPALRSHTPSEHHSPTQEESNHVSKAQNTGGNIVKLNNNCGNPIMSTGEHQNPPLTAYGDGSNLSSASSEREGGETPEKGGSYSQGSLSQPMTAPSHTVTPGGVSLTGFQAKTGSEKKRKRRKPPSDIDLDPPPPNSKNQRAERRIEDFFSKKSIPSPQREKSQMVFLHGEGSFHTGSLQFEPISPQPVTVGLPQRSTPTNVMYAGSDGSASNHSPPSLTGHHVLVQTEETISSLKAIEEDNLKSEAKAENYLKIIEEMKIELLKKERKISEQQELLTNCREQTAKLLIEQSLMERKQRRTQTMEDRLRLGQFTNERRGANFEEVWSDGYSFKEVDKRLEKICKEREDINKATTLLRKSRKPNSSGNREKRNQAPSSSTVVSGDVASTSGASPISDDPFLRPETPKEKALTLQEYYEQDEIYRLRREQLKKEEAEQLAERSRLDRERNLHIREMKRIQAEDASRYKDHMTLNKRYLLLSLLGKGGFSEVWRAFDLEGNKYVACKIHHVNKDWKEDKKANYVKHALREKDIHKTLTHPRIVKLWDVFTIDNHSFCTVLEYCDGNDLDFFLKQNKQIPEKEARSIIMQVVSALRYLNELKPPVIHYDLKPANILLSSSTASGEVKITDFGLSKIMEDDKCDPDVGMDLTSQGAGTYWYLPPECFVLGHQPPKINSKVDVWSVGVIFYQCLYGRRPFGHEQTQARILEEKTILNATEVTFPTKPAVTPEAKYRKEDRADVFHLYNNEYLRPTRGNRSSNNMSPAPTPSAPIVVPTSSTASLSGSLPPCPQSPSPS